MKKRTVFLMTFVLVALLVVGGTMAWFTAETDPVFNNFTAGTVKIDLIDDFNGDAAKNVNPGDSYDKLVRVENTGSKRVYVRVQLTPKWTLAQDKSFPVGFDANSLAPAQLLGVDAVNWVKIGNYYYYKLILNNKDAQDGKVTTNLITGVKFIGADMGNEYQGATFELEVKAEAIQATNGAIEDLWKIDPATWVAIPQP